MRSANLLASAAIVAIASFCSTARADEGGISFWLPGAFGGLAAAPQHTTGLVNGSDLLSQSESGGDVARAREITIGNIPANVTANF